ncbi:MAG: hypothetical protein WB952_17420 [Terriglobales bacterium]
MPKSAPARVDRAPRVRLAGTVLALVKLENGRQLRAKLHQLSVSGGLANVEKPFDEGIKVELIFHVGNSTVRSQARMKFPMWATQGCLQPFEFEDLGEEERQQLQTSLQNLLTNSAAASVPTEDTSGETPSDSSQAS